MHHENRPRIGCSYRNQDGIALVVSLVLLLATTVLGVSGAQKAMLNQNLATSHKKQTKAFMAAQAGVHRGLKVANSKSVKSAVISGSSISSVFQNYISPYETKQTVGTNSNTGQYYISRAKGPNGTKLSFWNKNKNLLRFAAHGIDQHGAKRTIQIRVNFKKGSQPSQSPFTSALIARSGLDLTSSSSGTIDSYNSGYGKYGSQVTVNGKTFTNASSKTPKLRGHIARTCTSSGLIRLASGSPIYGDVFSKAGIKQLSGNTIYGAAHVNGKAIINGTIKGKLTAGNTVKIKKQGIVKKKVLSNGSIEDYHTVSGKVQAHGQVLFDSYSNIPGGATTSGSSISVSSPFKNGQPTINSGSSISYPSSFNTITPSPTANYHPNLSLSQLNLPTAPTVQSNQLGCKSPKNFKAFEQMFYNAKHSKGTSLVRWLKNIDILHIPKGSGFPVWHRAHCRRRRCWFLLRRETYVFTLHRQPRHALPRVYFGRRPSRHVGYDHRPDIRIGTVTVDSMGRYDHTPDIAGSYGPD